MKQAYQGSCHCGIVRFSCAVDLAPPGRRSPPELPGMWWTSTFRCNCSYCMKTRFWKVFARAKDFQLVAGQEALTDYQCFGKNIHHWFCRHCGIHPFANAAFEAMGGEFYAVNVGCLDNVSPEELAEAPVAYEDGRNDRWDTPPAVSRHL